MERGSDEIDDAALRGSVEESWWILLGRLRGIREGCADVASAVRMKEERSSEGKDKVGTMV